MSLLNFAWNARLTKSIEAEPIVEYKTITEAAKPVYKTEYSTMYETSYETVYKTPKAVVEYKTITEVKSAKPPPPITEYKTMTEVKSAKPPPRVSELIRHIFNKHQAFANLSGQVTITEKAKPLPPVTEYKTITEVKSAKPLPPVSKLIEPVYNEP